MEVQPIIPLSEARMSKLRWRLVIKGWVNIIKILAVSRISPNQIWIPRLAILIEVLFMVFFSLSSQMLG